MPLGLHRTELNFETIREIGQEGKNSEVFLAHDKQLDSEIVIKKIEKSKIANPIDYYDESYPSEQLHIRFYSSYSVVNVISFPSARA